MMYWTVSVAAKTIAFSIPVTVALAVAVGLRAFG